MIALKLIVNKWLRYLKIGNIVDLKTVKENKTTIYDLCSFWKYFSAMRERKTKS